MIFMQSQKCCVGDKKGQNPETSHNGKLKNSNFLSHIHPLQLRKEEILCKRMAQPLQQLSFLSNMMHNHSPFHFR